jgi:hypothetical protein
MSTKNPDLSLKVRTLFLKGWSIQRVLFVFLGVTIIIQSIVKYEWLGILVGLYFLVMGIFRLGCAGGNCAV